MKLEDIGFYTLSDKRAKESSSLSQMKRGEIIITDKCNFKCAYCRGIISEGCKGTRSYFEVCKVIDIWAKDNLEAIRFSGGEPTSHGDLAMMVGYARDRGIKRIAVSTNGSATLCTFRPLLVAGVNDISISLDACCASAGDKMAGGVKGSWKQVISNIKALSKLTYVTVGVVYNSDNVNEITNIIKFAESLGVADIRVIPSAQYGSGYKTEFDLPEDTLSDNPILNYRVNNFKTGRNIRGLSALDYNKCPLVLDDSAVAGNYHFPCIIYLREGGKPIGEVSDNMRAERAKWFECHNTHEDAICSKNCLDVCVDYNNKYHEFHLG